MMVLSCPLFGGFSGLEARLEDNNYWMSNIGGGGGWSHPASMPLL